MKSFKYTFLLIATFTAYSFISCKAQKEEVPWINLINSSSLDGWNIKGGEATYKNENGTIIGTTAPNTPNTFLCTNKNYTDFILELDFKVDPVMNSGIQIRSNSLPYYREEWYMVIR